MKILFYPYWGVRSLLCVILTFLVIPYFADAQIELVGVSENGGAFNSGAVYKISSNGSGFQLLHSFAAQNAANPGKLFASSDGKLYGYTGSGGYGYGLIYSVEKDGTGFTMLHLFDKINGRDPVSLIEGSDGKLYGLTLGSGDIKPGIIFRLEKDGSGYTKLKQLPKPPATGVGLLEASDGKLYGATTSWGSAPTGVLFRINKDGTSYKEVHQFNDNQAGSFFEGSDGMLYGAMSLSTPELFGAIFRMSKDGSGYEKIHVFDTSGWIQARNIIELSDGQLYGTTYPEDFSPSYVPYAFSLNKDGSGFQPLKYFSGANYASFSLELPDGRLLGTVSTGDGPAVVTMHKDGSGLQSIHQLDFIPELILADGQIFGSTLWGGQYFAGQLFRIELDGTGFNSFYAFQHGNADGSFPQAPLLRDGSGWLYGTTASGGKWNGGTIFKIREDGTDFNVMYAFLNTEGGPVGGLASGADGKIYGTTFYGGSNSAGRLFSISKDGNDFTTLHSFEWTSANTPSYFSLLVASDGMLYGCTEYGGPNYGGAIYRIGKDGSGFAVLHFFDGDRPTGPLIETSSGRLGGTSQSHLFFLEKDGTGFLQFGEDTYFQGGLTAGSGGQFFGISQFGNNELFQVNEDGSGFATLYTFPIYDFPEHMAKGPDGKIYGAVRNSAGGALYSINEDGSGFDYFFNFTGFPTSVDNPAGIVLLGPLVSSSESMSHFVASISPNPTPGVCNLSVQARQPGDFLLLVNDAQGRLVRRESITGMAEFQRHIDLTGLAPGVYSITLSSNEGFFSQKIVKQ